ncbi:MAG: ABC transporter substrate-binding protein, partial [Candidatus Thorarchaeota archaeon]
KRHLFSIQIALLLLLLTISPIVFASTDPLDDSRVNTIIWETIGLPEFMDPHKNYESAGGWVHANIYETLFTYDFDSADTTPSVPLLAESVHISSDGLNYTFTLRQGITFHDNTEFNATCVQMNFWRILGRGWDEGWGPVWMIATPILGGQAVEDAVYDYGDGSLQHRGNWTEWKETSDAIVVLDEFTVRIRLAYPYSPFLAVLASSVASMISPTFFMAHGGMSPESYDFTLDYEACGTGPYMLDEWIQDDMIRIVLNDNYWRTNSARFVHPYAGSIANVTIKLNTDVISRMSNLQAGTTDGCSWFYSKAYDIWNNVTTRGDGTLQSLNPDIKVWTGLPSYSIMLLGFNMNSYLNVSNELRQSPFTNWHLRTAISYAFDYQAMIDEYSYGMALQLQGPIPQGMFAHDYDLFMFNSNMTKAVEHWNSAMSNGLDDVWANNSYELNFYCMEGSSGYPVSLLLIKQAIENIIADPDSSDPSSPLTINVVGLEWASYLYQIRNRQLALFRLGWFPDYADPDNYVSPFVHSNGTFPRRVGLKDSLGEGSVVWDHETVNGWIEDAAGELNPDTRISLYDQIQEAIVEHCAYLWCYQLVEFHVERHEMKGYVYNPMRDPYFYHYYKSTVLPDGPPHIPTQVLLASIYLGICIVAIVILRRSSKG